MTAARLYGLYYSPWTERARWALDHEEVPYRFHHHVPMLGEPLLRWRGRRLGKGRVSVPLFVDGATTLGDSVEIMGHASRHGQGRLGADEPETRAWAERVEPLLQAGRALVAARTLADREALREAAMAASPAFFAGALRPVAALGARFIARKYEADLDDEARQIETMRDVCLTIREALEDEPSDRLTARAILLATALQPVAAVADRHIPLKPATRGIWSTPALAAELSDLLTWRDDLYDRFRKPPRARAAA
ncbi:MAG: glutathione S-transferase N-terminal domain-containing protein [Myxococcales bacterium]|nr:glutathione S-transferase N-terminal domain-containing protein [Myxococcales bacterium]